MNSIRDKLRFAVIALLVIAALVPEVLGQRLSKDELIAAAREIMITARYCALITVDSSGRTHARAMDPFPPEADMTVWFGTNSRSRKVREIRRHPRVTLYYFNRDEQAYVMLTGIARLVNDPKEKAKRWKEEWNDYYPDRAKDYLLILVTPERLEVVSEKKGIKGDPRTWKPPTVIFKSRKKASEARP